MTSFPHLFSPVRIGNATLRNRLAQAATVTLFSDHGVDSQRNLDYNVERARGGVGLIVTGNRLVHPSSTTGKPRYSWAYLREAVPGDRRMTAAVHEHGAAIFAQLNHFGVNASSDAADDLRVLWGPSPVKSPNYAETAKEMEHEEIRELVEWWARSAEVSRESGFDGVELHMAHSYLLHQFLSPVYNKRADEYGGSLDNRLRLSREVLDAVRRRVGSDFVVGVRLSLSDFIPGSLDLDDAIAVATALAATGQVDYLGLSAAGVHNLYLEIPPSDMPAAALVDSTARVKAAVPGLPVLVVGGLTDPAAAEEIVASGKADVVTMSRALNADPEFATKAREGRAEEIYRCIRCNQACIGAFYRGFPVGCTLNPATGREGRFGHGTLRPAAPSARWLVVGGGPAGMKAAETLARRGHRVTLVEREDRLGGQVGLILRTPGREPFAWIAEDLETQMRKHGVEIRLGTEATPALVGELGSDGVLVATGAVPSRTGFSMAAPLVERLPGVEQEHVVTPWDVLLGTRPVGERVVVLDDDGSRYAAGTAEVLLDAGRQVELVTPFTTLFPATRPTLDAPVVYRRLFEKGLAYRLSSWARRIDGQTVTIFNLYSRAEEALDGVDTVVLATGPEANDELYFQLKGQVENLHRIGDCVAPRRLDHAIYEGYLAGRELWSPEERYIGEGELERWREVIAADVR